MKHPFAKTCAIALTLLALIFSAVSVTPAYAATFTVTNLNDSGAGSLRQAVTNADAAPGADTITFSVSGTILLASTLPHITDVAGLTVDGVGKTVTISGNHAVQVTVVDSGASLNLKNLTITNSYGGSGISGAIHNIGTLAITNSTFSTNSVIGRGGAIFNNGTLNITNSTFSGNSAVTTGPGSGLGGAIYNYDSGTLNISNSIFSGNSATGSSGNGGAVYTGGTLTITNSTFSANSADINGGGLYAVGPVTITNSTFSGNSAKGNGGGAIFDSVGTMNITDGTFSGNSVTGGTGGAIMVNIATLTITNSTFSGNSANSGGLEGGLWNGGGTVILRNTIVAGSLPGNCGGAITNGGNNIDDGSTCGWGSASGSMSNTGPLLGALANNGGLTQTFALLTGSPAIDGVTFNAPNSAPATDQRGISRPQGARYDIGSYEAIVYSTLIITSNALQDGWVLESSELSNKGGSLNSLAKTFILGDDAARRQYRSILSFSSGAGLPDTAVITGLTLMIKKNTVVGGGNPLTMFKGFMVDIKNGFFGTSAALQTGDFQAKANQTVGPIKPALVSSWYSIDLTGAQASINKLATSGGLTQIRLRFKLDDNNNAVANYLRLYSGNAPVVNSPQLIIQYYVP